MDRLISTLKDNWHYILVGLLSMIVLLVVLIVWLFSQKNIEEPIVEEDIITELLAEDNEKNDTKLDAGGDSNESEESSESIPNTPQISEVIVDVKGAVHQPGVYTFSSDKRIIDAINQAGGLEADAESNSVNFAQILEDQMVIYIPKIGEEIVNQPTTSVPQTGSNNVEGATVSMVNINTADQNQLMTLNGIGNSKAENIINYREENGPFKTIEDIKKVSGIGDATFNNLKDYIVVTP